MIKAELLAPAGSMDALRAAVQNGADAVYLGCGIFNARQSAKNFTPQTLAEAVDELLCSPPAVQGDLAERNFRASWQYHVGGEPDEGAGDYHAGADPAGAADAANRAILAMADNSAKMGTDISSIQMASVNGSLSIFT